MKINWANEDIYLDGLAGYEIHYLLDDMLESLVYGDDDEKQLTRKSLKDVTSYLINRLKGINNG